MNYHKLFAEYTDENDVIHTAVAQFTEVEDKLFSMYDSNFSYENYAAFDAIVEKYNLGYYARSHERFSLIEANKLLKSNPDGVIVENLG